MRLGWGGFGRGPHRLRPTPGVRSGRRVGRCAPGQAGIPFSHGKRIGLRNRSHINGSALLRADYVVSAHHRAHLTARALTRFSRTFCLPSGVFGPVDGPPWSLQRCARVPSGLLYSGARHFHGLDRHCAPHLWAFRAREVLCVSRLCISRCHSAQMRGFIILLPKLRNQKPHPN